MNKSEHGGGSIVNSIKLEKIIKPRIATWFGVIAPIWGLMSIGISIALSPWFSWIDNALSDLGVSNVSPIFNSGLIICGTLASLFIVALIRIERTSRLGLAGSILLLLSSIILGIHFTLNLSSRPLGIFTLLVGIVSFISWVGWAIVRPLGVAIPETISAFLAFFWFFILSIRMYKENVRS
ncbi:MAG: DUF998 domain-containing protein [archaeon]|nr:DUF998 domain-containing protein [archaeon]MCP8319898.1 DUF998 domain-containing protein [archaeon]